MERCTISYIRILNKVDYREKNHYLLTTFRVVDFSCYKRLQFITRPLALPSKWQKLMRKRLFLKCRGGHSVIFLFFVFDMLFNSII